MTLGMPSLTDAMNTSISQMLRQAWKVVAANPSLSAFALKTIRTQARSAKKRAKSEQAGMHVPPFVIVSITNRCNLACKGCYSSAQHRSTEGELTVERLRDLFSEAQELGVSFMLLAGGEPLARPEVIHLAGAYKDVIFPVFTNGTLIDDAMVGFLAKARNVVPVVSLEGDKAATDGRRGDGVYEEACRRMASMKANNVFYGVSLTVTSANIAAVTSRAFMDELIALGCRLVFFVEYVPVDESSSELTLTESQREELAAAAARFRAELPAIFISFPGDEEAMGGCLAAGRGFVHISARGEVEPCPFAPWSDSSLSRQTLADALKSPFLAAIRDNHETLGETSGGCALWAKREFVRSLLAAPSGDDATL